MVFSMKHIEQSNRRNTVSRIELSNLLLSYCAYGSVFG